MKAWCASLWGEEPSIVLAARRSQAKAALVASARRAGYDVSFTAPAKVHRAPEFDAMPYPPRRPIVEEYARSLMERRL